MGGLFGYVGPGYDRALLGTVAAAAALRGEHGFGYAWFGPGDRAGGHAAPGSLLPVWEGLFDRAGAAAAVIGVTVRSPRGDADGARADADPKVCLPPRRGDVRLVALGDQAGVPLADPTLAPRLADRVAAARGTPAERLAAAARAEAPREYAVLAVVAGRVVAAARGVSLYYAAYRGATYFTTKQRFRYWDVGTVDWGQTRDFGPVAGPYPEAVAPRAFADA